MIFLIDSILSLSILQMKLIILFAIYVISCGGNHGYKTLFSVCLKIISWKGELKEEDPPSE